MGGTFHGATVVTLDAKGRLAIPTRHRDTLLSSAKYLVLTAHPEGCVLVYPAAAWEPRHEKATPERILAERESGAHSVVGRPEWSEQLS